MQQRMYTRRFMRGLLSLGLLVGSVVLAGPAQAQTTSAGPYYAMPSWDQTLTATRFIILSNFLGAAVLDRETGLVWEKTPQTALTPWLFARRDCTGKTTGGRKGWRLPSVHELASLLDPTQGLPLNHPFTNVVPAFFWSATTSGAEGPTNAWYVNFDFVDNSVHGDVHMTPKTENLRVWCVRGGMNAEAY